MNSQAKQVRIHWAGGCSSAAAVGSDWLAVARAAGRNAESAGTALRVQHLLLN